MDSADPGLRYVTDVPYARRFVRELAPEWLDFAARICGYTPPAWDPGFAWCELGCGHGVTPVLLAAMHPQGRFLGFDLMPEHIDFARALCQDARIGNAEFQALDFAAAAALDLPQFDYIVAHGVYSWVDATARADLRRFVARHLKPGGLAYLSYNCLPGWAEDMPRQHLLLELAAEAKGDSIARFLEADRIASAVADAGATVLRQGAIGKEWDALREKLPAAYFVHEFLPPGWQPLYVTDMRRDMAEIGLSPLGSATIRENVDVFTLEPAARALVAQVADGDLRELMRDCFLKKRFRRDLYGRAVKRLDADDARREIAAGRFMLAYAPPQAPDDVTAAETGVADGPESIAQAILDLLARGPGSPALLLGESPGIKDLVPQIIALAAAGRIWPVAEQGEANSGEADPVARVNAVIRARIGGPDEVGFLALPWGTAIELNGDQLRRYRDRGEMPAPFATTAR